MVELPKRLIPHYKHSPMCRKCIQEYCEMRENGEIRGPRPFPPICQGDLRVIPEGLSEEDRNRHALMDCARWAQYEFEDPWNPGEHVSLKERPYQADMVSCTSRFKVYRMGRRTGKSFGIVLALLHRAFINRKHRVLILAPKENQVQNIFSYIDDLVGSSKMMSGMRTRRKRNPEYIEFSNGSTIKGYCIDSSSGTDPDKVRSESADIIYADEADYIPEEDWTPVLAILATNKTAEMWMTSTPTGLKKRFYNACTQKDRQYKEFYYPAQVSPEWTPEIEHMLRLEYTLLQWQHEVEAIFGDVEGGVYPKSAIDASLQNYTFEETRKRGKSKGCFYAMGIDWNNAPIGIHIVMVEWNYKDNIFKLVDKVISDDIHFTQNVAINEIMTMYQQWWPDLVWADAGHGDMQLETLRAIALEHPDLELLDKLHGVRMGDFEEIPDPFTGKKDRKRVKQLIVDLTLRRVEEFMCVFPLIEDDAAKMGLVHQMREFRVEKYTAKGDPVYTKEDDHTLAAWHCAMYALILHYTGIKNPYLSEHMTGSTKNPFIRNGQNVKLPADTGSINISPHMREEIEKQQAAVQSFGRVAPLGSTARPSGLRQRLVHRGRGLGRRGGGRSNLSSPTGR